MRHQSQTLPKPEANHPNAQPNTRAIVQPEPSFRRLFHRYFESFTSPQAFDPLVVHQPACIPQQCGNPTIAVSTILADHIDHLGNQPVFIGTAPGSFALRRTILTQHPAGPPL